MSRTLVDNLRQQIQGAHEFISGTMADVTAEQAHWQPPGTANPIGAQYVHVLTAEDGVVNGMIRGGTPLFASEFAGRAGFSSPPPQSDTESLPNWHAWARDVEVDLDQLREYAAAMHQRTESYLESLSDEDLARPLEHPAVGDATVGRMLDIAVLNNTQWHCGEISCLKGIQGAKGYPV